MSTDSRYPPRMTRTELRRAAPWWERTLYVLAFLWFAVFLLLMELFAHAPDAWRGQTTSRLSDIAIFVAMVGFPLDVAAFALAAWRRQPALWRDALRLWSTRPFLLASGVLYASLAWMVVGESFSGQAGFGFPAPPRIALVLFFVALGLVLVAGVLVLPEYAVRAARAKRANGTQGRQP